MGFFGGGGASGYPPVTSTTGAVQVGLSGGDALGTDAINIQPNRSATNQVASNLDSIVIGGSARAFDGGATGTQIVIGKSASARYRGGVAIGANSYAHEDAVSLKGQANQTGSIALLGTCGGTNAIAIGAACDAQQQESTVVGRLSTAGHFRASVFGAQVSSLYRNEVAFVPFRSAYWSGQTTDATPTVLNIDGTATNRFTIAANTLVLVDLLIAANSTGAAKPLISPRFVGIRRDGSNNTSLVGSVQNLGSDQNTGSPAWTVEVTADDTNEALQVAVTGAASETVAWRIAAFYRVV